MNKVVARHVEVQLDYLRLPPPIVTSPVLRIIIVVVVVIIIIIIIIIITIFIITERNFGVGSIMLLLCVSKIQFSAL